MSATKESLQKLQTALFAERGVKNVKFFVSGKSELLLSDVTAEAAAMLEAYVAGNCVDSPDLGDLPK